MGRFSTPDPYRKAVEDAIRGVGIANTAGLWFRACRRRRCSKVIHARVCDSGRG